MRALMGVLQWVPSALVLLPWLLSTPAPSTENRLRELSGPVSFRLLDWETANLGERAGRLWTALVADPRVAQTDVEVVRSYFGDRASRTDKRAAAEAAIERLVSEAFEAAGVSRSAPLRSDRLFPPVLVALTPPPNVFVVSPRTELRVTGSIVLQALEVAAQERLEASADSAGLSSLVAPIGGLATYPSMVLEDGSAERVLASVAHEWLHHYLVFYPLGARYWDSQEAREINETTADMIGREIAEQLTSRLDLQPSRGSLPPREPGTADFDFRSFMRATRLEIERLLAAAQVEEAEHFMRQQRDELGRRGYAIRKLNQAYFALYGSYGGGFAASPRNPIPDLLRQLRDESGSLADFLVRVRTVTSVAELRAALS